MRTLAIVLGTILVCIVIGVSGYWIGQGNFGNENAIRAEINPEGNLEITAWDRQSVQITSVTFNDNAGIPACSSRPPDFRVRTLFWANGWQDRWYRSQVPVTLGEGNIVVVPFDRAACGDKIVKAVVVTNLRTYTFRNQQLARTFCRGCAFWQPLKLDRWYTFG